MKNYKISHQRPAISRKKSMQMENFDELISAYEMKGKSSYKRKGFIGGVLLFIGIAGVVFYGMYQDPNEKENIGAIVEIEQLEEHEPKVEIMPDIETQEPQRQNLQEEEGVAKEDPVYSSKKTSEDIAESEAKTNDENEIGFIGAVPVDGFPSLYRYFEENLTYPDDALADGAEGNVIVKFVIDTTGFPIHVLVEKSLQHKLDSAAIVLIKNMPRWHPAKLNGNPMKSTQRIPLFFQIEQITEQ